MKKTILTVGLAIFLVTAFTAISSACDFGCTPGYWKQAQHFGNWDGYSTDDFVDVIFGCGPHITLLEALQAGGGGEDALTRHAVASLLNAAERPCFDGGPEGAVIAAYCAAYGSSTCAVEHQKNLFETDNEQDCDLGRAELQELSHKLYLIRVRK